MDNKDTIELGKEMHALASILFPICRSITGDGFRESLALLQKHIPLKIYEVPTGTKAFDWEVPKEWNIRDAYILDEGGNKIIDFKKNNLHIVGYSIPVDKKVSLSELNEHLYSKSEQPDAIPFITSYYAERWGFCLTQNQRDQLKEGTYHVYIDSELKDGSLTYCEYIIPGETEKEVFLSTYACHPSMANNELSGPVVGVYLLKWIASMPRKYTYRFIVIPETIGSLVYLSRNAEVMKKNIIAGFNLTCLGDDRTYSFMPSRNGNTLADRASLAILRFDHADFRSYSYLERGGDERQYCSPGIDLPVASVMRSKYYEYPEYHTSLDNLADVVTPLGLAGGYEVIKNIIELIEANEYYKAVFDGEPQLGKRGLYPTLSTGGSVNTIMDFLAYSDGKMDLIQISETIKVSPRELYPVIAKLLKEGLIKVA